MDKPVIDHVNQAEPIENQPNDDDHGKSYSDVNALTDKQWLDIDNSLLSLDWGDDQDNDQSLTQDEKTEKKQRFRRLTTQEKRFIEAYLDDPRHDIKQALRTAGYGGGLREARVGQRILGKAEKSLEFRHLLTICNVGDFDLALKADELLNCGDKRIEFQTLRLLMAVRGHLNTEIEQKPSTTIHIHGLTETNETKEVSPKPQSISIYTSKPENPSE